MRKITLLFLILICSSVFSQNLRRLNKDIIDENNNEVKEVETMAGEFSILDEKVRLPL